MNNRLLLAVQMIGRRHCRSALGVVGSILKVNMTEPTTESEKALALPHLVAAIETKSQMAKDWRLPEYFRDIYRRGRRCIALRVYQTRRGDDARPDHQRTSGGL